MGLAVIVLAFTATRAGNNWVRWATPVIAGTYAAALVYTTKFALLPDAVPIIVTTTLLGMVIVAAVLSLFHRKSA